MTLSQAAVVRALNQYIFETVWSAPDDEVGVNLQLFPANPRFLSNSIVGDATILLPVPGQQYAVYWLNHSLFEDSLVIPPNTWVGSDQLGNVHRTLFHVYAETGLMLPKAAVLLYYQTRTGNVYIAVQKAPLVKIVGLVNWQTLYLSIYRYNGKYATPLTIASYTVATPDPTQSSAGQISAAMRTALATVPRGTFVYVNGLDVSSTISTVSLNPGDYVDIYTDTRVVGMYTVNLTTTVTGYFSQRYQVYKNVLHCPKGVNPNRLITPTVMLTLTARRNTDQVGSFVHRNELNGLTQITHSDVGLNTSVVDAYRQSLGCQDLSIEVRIRTHHISLVPEASYIADLYLANDATILNFLIGHGDPSLPFWTATALEQAAYVTYMTTPPANVTPQTLGTYISGLGYYNVLAALCCTNPTYTIDRLPVTAISVEKPLVLCGEPVYPLVYLDGTKLRDTQVDAQNTRMDRLVFSLTPDVYAQIGQTLSVELLETGVSIPYLFTPNATAATLTVPYGAVVLYQVNALATPVVGYQVTATTSYTPIPLNPGCGVLHYPTSPVGGTELVFDASCYGNTYLIQNAVFSRCYGADITSQVTAKRPVHIELTTVCSDTTTTTPLLGYQTLAVYLNGKRMLPGIDYAANPITDSAGNTAIVQLMLCNRDALSLTGSNYLEVIAHTGVTVNQTIGYVANNQLNIRNDVDAWYGTVTTAFAGGALLIAPTQLGDALVPQNQVGNGLPYMLTTVIPSSAAAAVSNYDASADIATVSLINTYLNQQPPVNDISQLIIPHSWQVYSPYLTAILYDATQPGTIPLFNNTDPSDSLFEQQFANYAYLLANDPTLTPSISAIDRRYCDVFPCYATVSVSDPAAYDALHRLASLCLPPDSDTLGDIVNA